MRPTGGTEDTPDIVRQHNRMIMGRIAGAIDERHRLVVEPINELLDGVTIIIKFSSISSLEFGPPRGIVPEPLP